MAEARRGPGLAMESFLDFWPILGCDVGDLQDDLTIELRIVGQVDAPHPSVAQLLEDLVAPELGG